MAKRELKRANGTGSIYRMAGRRRNPWRVVICTGWNEEGKSLRQTIGYFPNKDAATVALANYRNNPYDIEASKVTFEEVYKRWSKEKFPSVSESNVSGYEASFRRCETLYIRRFKDITLDNLQSVIDTCGCNYPTLKKIKILFNQLYKYAIPRRLTDVDYSTYVNINKYKERNPNKFDRTAFTEDEIKFFWAHSEAEIGKIVLMLIYSGLRITEFLNLRKSDVILGEQCYIYIRQSKTQAGIRIVPIADKVKSFWEHFYNKNDSEFLVSMDGRSFEGTSKEAGYRAFKDTYFDKFMKFNVNLGKRHIHETRHTTETLLAEAGVDPTTRDKIIGHSGRSIGDDVYTHLAIQHLIDAINRI